MKNTRQTLYFATPYVFIAGSYERSRNNDNLCKILGFELAKYDIGLISAGGPPALKILSSMDKAMSDMNQYEPTKLLTFYRKRVRPNFPNVTGIGCFIFVGRDLKELRSAMIAKARVMIVIGGSGRTKEEVELAERNNIPVIPIGMSGGVAAKFWLDYSLTKKDSSDVFGLLNNKNPFVAAGAAIEILQKIIKRDD